MPSLPLHVENLGTLPKATLELQNMYPLSNRALRENPAPQQDVDDMSINCNCGTTETELSGPSPAPVVAHNGSVNNHPSTALWDLRRSAQFTLFVPVSVAKLEFESLVMN